MGSWYAGVRVHPERCAEWLETRYAAHHVPAVDAQPNFSLLLRTPENSSPIFRRSHTVYRGRCPLVRTSNVWRAVGALDRVLGRLEDRDPALLATRQLVITRGDRALLVPTSLLPRLERVEQDLNARGMWLADPPFADLHPLDATVVIGNPDLKLDGSSQWNPLDPVEWPSVSARPTPGRYHIATWLMFVPDRTIKRLPEMRALASALTLLDDHDTPVQDQMDKITELLGRVETEPIHFDKADALVERFDELLP